MRPSCAGADLECLVKGGVVRVSLVYNSNSGDGVTPDEIVSAISRHGHELVAIIEKEADFGSVFEKPCDLVVAAGGDGTVALVARVIARHRVPMAILPLGAANNIALTLGVDAPVDELIEGWKEASKQPLDLGIARGPWGEQLFVESVGVGLIPSGIMRAKSRERDESDRSLSNLARTAHVYRDALSRLHPHRCTISVDGTSVTGEFLMIEAFNIPFVGPNLVFTADANPSDGLLSVVVAREDDRQRLDDYLRQRMEGTECPISMASYCGRRIDIENPGCLHVDDEIYRSEPSVRVALELEGGALEILV
jgi:diacylglycerol kinase (ATP)